MREFIAPNWHVVLMHYPLALLTLGLIVELFSRCGFCRRNGRWMILVGALFTLPTAMAGLYAFRSVVTPAVIDLEQTWPAVRQASPWSAEQWDLMEMHIWYNAGGAVLLLLLSCLYIAGSDRLRSKLHWPMLILLLAGVGLLEIGAWHGGEAVYRHGTAIETAVNESVHGVKYFIPPLEMHLIFGGLVVAAAVLAAALTARRRPQPPARSKTVVQAHPINPAHHDEVDPANLPVITVDPTDGPPFIPASRIWVLATLLAIAAAFFGFWSVAGEFSVDAMRRVYETVTAPDHRRLLIHAVGGVVILLTPLLIAAFVRFMPGRRAIAGSLATILIMIAGWQIWTGTAMLFDSHDGPLLGFNAANAHAAESHSREHGSLEQPAATGISERPDAE